MKGVYAVYNRSQSTIIKRQSKNRSFLQRITFTCFLPACKCYFWLLIHEVMRVLDSIALSPSICFPSYFLFVWRYVKEEYKTPIQNFCLGEYLEKVTLGAHKFFIREKIFFKKVYLFLFGRQSFRERGRDRYLPSTTSFPNSQEPHPGVLNEWQGPKYLGHLVLLSQVN